MTRILEESKRIDGDRIATVQTPRGELLINVDKAVCGLAEFIMEHDHEKRMGWDLGTGWYEDMLKRIRERSSVVVEDSRS